MSLDTKSERLRHTPLEDQRAYAYASRSRAWSWRARARNA